MHDGMGVVDFHAHVYPADRAGFWRRSSSTDELVAAMDDAGISRAAVIAIAPMIPNEVVADAVAEHPTRLVPIGSVDPHDRAALATIDHAVRRLGVRAIKVHPRLQHFGMAELKLLVPIAECCGRFGVPLVVCSFIGGPGMYRGRVLELCGELAEACPQTTIVLAHAGGHRALDAFLLLKAHRNAMADLSFSPTYFSGSSAETDLAFLVRRSNPHQLLFGSDFPEVSMKASLDAVVALMQSAHVSASDQEAILSTNARRVLRLDS